MATMFCGNLPEPALKDNRSRRLLTGFPIMPDHDFSRTIHVAPAIYQPRLLSVWLEAFSQRNRCKLVIEQRALVVRISFAFAPDPMHTDIFRFAQFLRGSINQTPALVLIGTAMIRPTMARPCDSMIEVGDGCVGVVREDF